MSASPFLWGAATAGHQVEGNNCNAGIWLLEQMPGTSFAAPSGDACDSLHRWREDIALVGALGLNAYRFSVEWSRIEPAEGQFSTAWLDHYTRIAAACRAQGIAPVVTLSHFTSPRWFAAAAGWGNDRAPMLFGRFTARVAERMAPFVRHVITFNEPNLPLMGRWVATPIADPARASLDAMMAAAAQACGSDRFAVWVYSRGDDLPRLLAGHRAARGAWNAIVPTALIGMSLAIPETVGDPDSVAAYRSHAEAPFFAAAREDDFIGVQNDGRMTLSPSGFVPPPPGTERTQSGDAFHPEALGPAATHAFAATGRPVFVTENGIAAADDAQRARFIPAAMTSLDAARRQGVPVIGYCHWSLMDNFEWRRGYTQQFGLHAITPRTFRRTAKPSARRYAAIVAAQR